MLPRHAGTIQIFFGSRDDVILAICSLRNQFAHSAQALMANTPRIPFSGRVPSCLDGFVTRLELKNGLRTGPELLHYVESYVMRKAQAIDPAGGSWLPYYITLAGTNRALKACSLTCAVSDLALRLSTNAWSRPVGRHGAFGPAAADPARQSGPAPRERSAPPRLVDLEELTPPVRHALERPVAHRTPSHWTIPEYPAASRRIRTTHGQGIGTNLRSRTLELQRQVARGPGIFFSRALKRWLRLHHHKTQPLIAKRSFTVTQSVIQVPVLREQGRRPACSGDARSAVAGPESWDMAQV